MNKPGKNRLKINFWLNTPSPHLAGFISSISFYADVTVITPEYLTPDRVEMGWKLPNFGKAKVLKADTLYVDKNIEGSINVFSGFFSYKFLFIKTLKALFKSSSKFILLMEKPKFNSKRGLLIWLKYKLLSSFLSNKVAMIGSIGAGTIIKGLFKKVPFYEMCYLSDFNPKKVIINNTNSLIFVGRFVECKSIPQLLHSFHRSKFEKLHLIGDGPELSKIQDLIKSLKINNQVKLSGFVKNSDLQKSCEDSSTLVLPSSEEGWGVVVNEALLMGKKVVVSDGCGSAAYFKNLPQVFTFKSGAAECLLAALNNAFSYKITENDYLMAKRLLDKEKIAKEFVKKCESFYE